MKAKIGVVGVLISIVTAGVAELSLSQSKARSAQAQRHTLQWHGAAPADASLAAMEFDGLEAQFWLTDSTRPAFPSREDLEGMTPEQRDVVMRRFMEGRLRDGLTKAGFSQDDLQDAVVDFSRALETDRRAIREKCGKLRGAMAEGSSASDGQISFYMADLRRSVAAAKTHRDQGRKVLNNKISFTKKPRLDAFLSMWGLGGDESSYLMSSFGGRDFRRRSFGNSGR